MAFTWLHDNFVHNLTPSYVSPQKDNQALNSVFLSAANELEKFKHTIVYSSFSFLDDILASIDFQNQRPH